VVETFARVASLRLGEPGELALFGDSTANTGAGEAVGRFAGPERPTRPVIAVVWAKSPQPIPAPTRQWTMRATCERGRST
jgi:hypothetical protein